MDAYFPAKHLINITSGSDNSKVYMLGFGVEESDLTDNEKEILKDSRKYIQYRNKE